MNPLENIAQGVSNLATDIVGGAGNVVGEAVAGGIGSAAEALSDSLVNKVMNAILYFFSSIVAEIMNSVTGDFIPNFGPSMNTFFKMFGVEDASSNFLADKMGGIWLNYSWNSSSTATIVDIFGFFAILGLVLATSIFVISMASCAFAEYVDVKDTPVQLIVRYFAAIIMIAFAPSIIDLFFDMAGSMWNLLLNREFVLYSSGMTAEEAAIQSVNAAAQHAQGIPAPTGPLTVDQAIAAGVTPTDQAIQNAAEAINGALGTVNSVATMNDPIGSTFVVGGNLLVGLICNLIFLWEFMKYVVEIVERYIVTCVLYMVFPAVAGSFVSRKTSLVASYFKMLASQLILLFMNLIFIRLIILVFRAQGRAGIDTPVAGVAFNFVIIMGLIRVATRMDSYMRSLGLNTAITGGSILDSIGGGIRTMLMMGQTIARGMSAAQEASRRANMNNASNSVAIGDIDAAKMSLEKANRGTAMNDAQMSDALKKLGASDEGIASAMSDSKMLQRSAMEGGDVGMRWFNGLPAGDKSSVLSNMMGGNLNAEDQFGRGAKLSDIKATKNGFVMTASVPLASGAKASANVALSKTAAANSIGRITGANGSTWYMNPVNAAGMPIGPAKSFRGIQQGLYTGKAGSVLESSIGMSRNNIAKMAGVNPSQIGGYRVTGNGMNLLDAQGKTIGVIATKDNRGNIGGGVAFTNGKVAPSADTLQSNINNGSSTMRNGLTGVLSPYGDVGVKDVGGNAITNKNGDVIGKFKEGTMQFTDDHGHTAFGKAIANADYDPKAFNAIISDADNPGLGLYGIAKEPAKFVDPDGIYGRPEIVPEGMPNSPISSGSGTPLGGDSDNNSGITGSEAPLGGDSDHSSGNSGGEAPLGGDSDHSSGITGGEAPLGGDSDHSSSITGGEAPLGGDSDHSSGITGGEAPLSGDSDYSSGGSGGETTFDGDSDRSAGASSSFDDYSGNFGDSEGYSLPGSNTDYDSGGSSSGGGSDDSDHNVFIHSDSEANSSDSGHDSPDGNDHGDSTTADNSSGSNSNDESVVQSSDDDNAQAPDENLLPGAPPDYDPDFVTEKPSRKSALRRAKGRKKGRSRKWDDEE